MASIFSSLNIARSGIRASEQALNTVGHNLTNVNTPGFSRQQTMIAESNPIKYPTYTMGLGADIKQTRQIRHLFLDNMYRQEKQTLSYFEGKAVLMKQVEDVFCETTETPDIGLSRLLNKFFEDFNELGKDPASITVRTHVRESADILVEAINRISNQLQSIQADLNDEIMIKADRINEISNQIVQLNEKIIKYEVCGDNANDLRDQRNLLLDELTSIVNINYEEKTNGAINVYIGTEPLVYGVKKYEIAYQYNDDKSMFYDIVWKDSENKLQINSGELLALIEVRGNVEGYPGSVQNGGIEETTTARDKFKSDYANGLITGDVVEKWVEAQKEDLEADIEKFNYTSDRSFLDYAMGGTRINEGEIPAVIEGLNMMINIFARQVNIVHESGFGLDGSTGTSFFVPLNEDLPISITNIAVNPLFTDTEGLNKIAASSNFIRDEVTGERIWKGELSDDTNAWAIVDIKRMNIFQYNGVKTTLDSFYNSFISNLATVGNEVITSASNQAISVNDLSQKRDAFMGVSIDNEMANMIKFQHHYNSCVRVMNTINDMIETLVLRTGKVGL